MRGGWPRSCAWARRLTRRANEGQEDDSRVAVRAVRAVGLSPLIVLVCLVSCAPQVVVRTGGCPQPLALNLTVREQEVNGEWHPIVVVVLRNTGAHPVAVSRAVNVINRPGLMLAVKRLEDGRFLPLPYHEAKETEWPEYRCVGAGDVHRWEIDLLGWWVVAGRQEGFAPRVGDLPDGTYRAHAWYQDTYGGEGQTCPRVVGWIEDVYWFFDWSNGRLGAAAK